MKKALYLSITVLLLIYLTACSRTYKSDKHVLYVAAKAQPHKTDDFENVCLYVKRYAHNTEWQPFFYEIKGFHYQAGYTYKLLVRPEKILYPEAPNCTICYHLVKIIYQKEDK